MRLGSRVKVTTLRTGETITLTRLQRTGTGNPFDPDITQTNTTTLKALVAPIDQRRVDGTSIMATDLSCLLPGIDAPTWLDTTTTALHRSDTYKVAQILRWPVVGEDAVIELILRR